MAMNNLRDALVTASGLSKTYQGESSASVEALRGVELTVVAGEIVCILGQSGCGKTTLLNLIAGLLEPTAGTLSVCGLAPSEARLQISYIQQLPQLLPYRTVFANAAVGLELRGSLNPTSISRVHELLEFLKLREFLSSYPAELSGGMRQRVALARTLAIHAPLLLCDEPFSSLDFDNRLEIEEFFWNASKKEGRACILITHHIDSAIVLADRIVILTPRPGKVSAIISIDEKLRNESPLKRRDTVSFTEYFAEVWHSLRTAI